MKKGYLEKSNRAARQIEIKSHSLPDSPRDLLPGRQLVMLPYQETGTSRVSLGVDYYGRVCSS